MSGSLQEMVRLRREELKKTQDQARKLKEESGVGLPPDPDEKREREVEGTKWPDAKVPPQPKRPPSPMTPHPEDKGKLAEAIRMLEALEVVEERRRELAKKSTDDKGQITIL